MLLVQTISVTAAGGAADITFSSIPQDATDLVLLCSLIDASGNANMNIQINGNTGLVYSNRALYGSGTTTTSNNVVNSGDWTLGAMPGGGVIASSNLVYFPNYSGSAAKTASAESVTEANASAAQQWLFAGSTSITGAISSIKIYSGSGGNLRQFSSVSLYKVTKA
jgi:hypothetical protein